jgi:tetratricopeptide (TPR) repeat protein
MKDMDSRFGSVAILFCAVVSGIAVIGTLGSCQAESGGIQGAMRPKSVQAKDKSSLSVDQLAQAIAGYSTEAERRKLGDAVQLGLDASANLGAYRLELADRYIGKTMFKDAYDVLVLASQTYTDDARLYYNAGMSAAHVAKSFDVKGSAGAMDKAKWFATAESCYKRSLAINPRSTQALYGMAVLYSFELERPSEAVGFLSNLLGIETKNVDAMMLLARCYAQLGKIDEAANWYETAAQTTVVPEKKRTAEENRAKLLAGQGTQNGK